MLSAECVHWLASPDEHIGLQTFEESVEKSIAEFIDDTFNESARKSLTEPMDDDSIDQTFDERIDELIAENRCSPPCWVRTLISRPPPVVLVQINVQPCAPFWHTMSCEAVVFLWFPRTKQYDHRIHASIG